MKRIIAILLIAAFVLCSWGCSDSGLQPPDHNLSRGMVSADDYAAMNTNRGDYSDKSVETIDDTGDKYESRVKALSKFLEDNSGKAK